MEKRSSRVVANMIVLDGTPSTQINKIVSHPTLSLLVTAHEDKFIRIFDLTTGTYSPYGLSDVPYLVGLLL